MARLDVPLDGQVRKPRAVEDHSAPIPKEITSELGMIIQMDEGLFMTPHLAISNYSLHHMLL